ncbi:PLP-dependent transferase [Glarea lozoyensis ATCC 20868]|uniref:PLP-dependent transferase n=1 Tax=Glarea lozoyensis (strain ATCC 20868 / MF5171) TaxID=1116229 RepID=S3CMN0_GLAL2|nr:PLP-dependent transferase [Glarea lozoyensis ATCC 20868]EPE26985.1 PLP-dependent transferase [Glarea lozoyensis ATCC 20868]
MASIFETVKGLSNGNQIADKSSSRILHPNIHRANPKVISAKGLYMTLENGQIILDATGGPAVTSLGHGNEEVRNAVIQQMDRLSYCHGLSWANPAAEELATAVIDSTDGAMARATMMGSGSEAVEAALKLARQYAVESGEPERFRFIARKGGFHGTTLGALAVTERHGVRDPFEPLLMMDNISFVSTPNLYRGIQDGETTAKYVERLAKELDDEFKRVGPQEVAAFIAETFTGSSTGCLGAPFGYFPAVKAICEKHGSLLILDEVICGMGRTGTYHAWQQENVTPDIQTVAKGLAGGYSPIAMLLMNQKVVDGLLLGRGFFNHGHTYGFHPVACAAAAEVQKILKRDNLLQNVTAMGDLLGSELKEAFKDNPNVGDIRGRGLFWAVEFVSDKSSKKPFPATKGVARKIKQLGMTEKHNIALQTGSGTVDGEVGDHLLISPPYTVTAEEIETIVKLAVSVVEEVLSQV